jgi:cytochrome c5
MRTLLIAGTALSMLSFAFQAQAAERTGREVVEKTCAACHANGTDGAPKIGDFAVWAQRAKNGFGKLTESAIAGTGKMPAHGGQSDLTDLEISRAIAFMASGGRATDPSKPYASPTKGTGEQLVESHCVKCHGTGSDGAPRTNNFADWKPRLDKGMDAVLQSAIRGHKGMPARAGLASLSDSDLRNAVTYMIVQSASYKTK